MPKRHKGAPPEEQLYAPIEWTGVGEWEDIRYETGGGIAKVTIDRPDVLNSFRPQTLIEVSNALELARVQGIAVGGGNELQMACDLALMSDDAFIRHVGLEHGSVPAGGATQWLPIMIGDRRAREMILLCDEVPAAQAAEWGLVNRAVPAGELDAVVDEWVEKLARKLPETTRYAKQQLNWWRDISWHETVGHARDWLALSMLGDEAQGAVKRFLERSK